MALQGGAALVAGRWPRTFWPVMSAGLLGGAWVVRPRGGAGWGRPPDRAGLVAGALAGVGLYGLTAAVAAAVGRTRRGGAALAGYRARMGSAPRPLARGLLVPDVVAEELLWRGAVQGALVAEGSPAAGLAGATAIYAATQAASGNPLFPLAAAALGLVTGPLALRTGSVWPGAVAHLVWAQLCLGPPGLPGGPSPVGRDPLG